MFDFDEIDDADVPPEAEAPVQTIGDQEDIDEMSRVLEDLTDPDSGIRWDACRALAKMGLIAVPQLPVIEKFANDEADDDVRRAAKQAVRKLKGEAGQEKVPPEKRGGRYPGRVGRALAAEEAARAKAEAAAAKAKAEAEAAAAAEAAAIAAAARNVEEDSDEERAAMAAAAEDAMARATGGARRRQGRFGQLLRSQVEADADSGDEGYGGPHGQPQEVYIPERDRPNDTQAFYLAPEAGDSEDEGRPALHRTQGLDVGSSGLSAASFAYMAEERKEKKKPQAKSGPDVSWDLVDLRAVFKIFSAKTKFELVPMRLEREGMTVGEITTIWERQWGVQYAGRCKFEVVPSDEDGEPRKLRRDDVLPMHPAIVRLEAGGSILYTLTAALKEYGKLTAAEAEEERRQRDRNAELGAKKRAQSDAKEGAKYKHIEARRMYDARRS